MNRRGTLGLSMLLAVAASGCLTRAQRDQIQARAEQPAIVAEIQKLGGDVVLDDKSPDKPVIGVILKGSQVTDMSLAVLAFNRQTAAGGSFSPGIRRSQSPRESACRPCPDRPCRQMRR